MDASKVDRYVSTKWDDEIVPQLVEYIRIPNKSPMFDADWLAHGYMDAAVKLMETWAKAQPIPGMQLEVVRLEGRTPLICIEIPASNGGSDEDCVLLYGHLDKQPEMTGWDDDLGPWKPVIKGDKLYGRGGADDGYAIFGSLAAILALQEQKVPHARCVVLIEACEESGSYDLPAYVDHLADRIGKPSLVVCLDSGCGNYEQLWCTTSLRGLAGGNLTVKVLNEGVHSGDASGIVPSSFRLLRQLLSRIEDENSGRILLEGLHVEVPAERLVQAKKSAEVLDTAIYDKFPFLPGMTPMADDLTELVLNRTWRPALSVTGADGMPALSSAGNVLRPHTSVKLSLRLPPTMDGKRAGELLKQALEHDPPNGAQVTLELEKASTGWNAPAMAPWLEKAIDASSREFFGQPAMYMGEGGTIPFMGMLGEKFPGAQFMITGVLGPHSNAHGPNEFLHIPMGKRVTACVARVIAEHHAASQRGETTGVAVVAGGEQHGDHGCC
ncbi:M20 family metallopeptidase [Lysobacter sp. CFH 32150]|uniref:M20 family metallopeptidase n=1 Tax=Lysobacter sp. CFH 32150 TaxID=2927128 RepID=UPI001FA7B2EF|nr:M20 family metallopeptidase [Lysobacter sp. CFH 32150]MCI4568766.1 M20 family metallopeptidase [Lysobacter sp. CFH 32150]